MIKNLVISILVVLLVGIVSPIAAEASLKKTSLVREGFALAGVEGGLVRCEKAAIKAGGCQSGWAFEFAAEQVDEKNKITAGQAVVLLPSAGLERVIASVADQNNTDYRLWGKVTKYNGQNFIFASYFLPVSKAEVVAPVEDELQLEPEQASKEPVISINDPNDELAIPEEIISKLSTRKVVRVEQLQEQPLELKADSILADRVGRLVEGADGGFVFVPDGLGRNIGTKFSLPLLPSQILGQALGQQGIESDPILFKVAGIVTVYKGRYYLLLQRATRVYNHGNFNS